MKILVFDNYDSFTYNLVHLLRKIINDEYGNREAEKPVIEVHLNDRITLEKIDEFDRIILSPGPGIPEEAGLLIPLIKRYASTKPILGVCLGHQAIGQAFGGKLMNLETVYHGVSMPVTITETNDASIKDLSEKNQKASSRQTTIPSLFANLPKTIQVGRYHSWIINEEELPENLLITARDEQGNIMAVRHKEFDIQGVQFHPESILTPDGETILRNWLFGSAGERV